MHPPYSRKHHKFLRPAACSMMLKLPLMAENRLILAFLLMKDISP